MPDEIKKQEYEITELDENAMEGVAGGAGNILDLVDNVDALGCKDNGNCPSCTTNRGNCVAGCT